jgi:hypothetical protein
MLRSIIIYFFFLYNKYLVTEYFSIMESKQEQISNSTYSKYEKGMVKELMKLSELDHLTKASPAIDKKSSIFIGEIIALMIKVDKLNSQFKRLERTVGWIGNYIEEQTGLEPGKELTNSSESDSD